MFFFKKTFVLKQAYISNTNTPTNILSYKRLRVYNTYKNVEGQNCIIKHENFTWYIVTSTRRQWRTIIARHFSNTLPSNLKLIHKCTKCYSTSQNNISRTMQCYVLMPMPV